jgi:hypothetical protein
MRICPICETENKPQATHCEVCGERLTPPAPGEKLRPEESVLSSLAHAKPIADPEANPAARAPAPQLIAAVPVPVFAPAPVAPAVPAVPAAPAFDPWAELEAQERARSGGGAAPSVAIPSVTIPPASPVVSLKPPSKVPDSFDAPSAPKPVAPAPVVAAPVVAAPVVAAPVAPARPVVAQPAQPAAPKAAPPKIVSSGIPSARLVVYQNRQPVYTHPVANDETLLGRHDPLSGSEPDLDLTPYDPSAQVSRKHAYVYRINGEYYLYPISNAGTQLGQSLIEMGERRKLQSGDVIILSGSLAMKFLAD